MKQVFACAALLVFAVSGASAREMADIYVVTQVANTTGQQFTDWHTDLTLYNPHSYSLPVVVQFLEAGRDNTSGVPTVEFDVYPWETLNLWNILGPNGFNRRGVNGALLVFADDTLVDCTAPACDFAVFARTYTISNRWNLDGEFGQAAPGYSAYYGLDWNVIGYLPQLMDDADFRTNVGIASLTNGTVKVRVDLQNADGDIIDQRTYTFPPFFVAQWRLPRGVTGGTAAVYLTDGPASALVFPYASVVNNSSGDAVTIEPQYTTVFESAAQFPGTARVRALRERPELPSRILEEGFSPEVLRRRPETR